MRTHRRSGGATPAVLPRRSNKVLSTAMTATTRPIAFRRATTRTVRIAAAAGNKTRTRSSRRRIPGSSPERGSPAMNAVVAKLRELESPTASVRLAGLVDRLELKEGYAEEHTAAVSGLALAIATELELGAAE